VIGAPYNPHDVGNDQPDEANYSGHRNRGRRNQGSRSDKQDPARFDRDPEHVCLFFAELKDVQPVGKK